ncbi:MAG: hypothetical protein ACFFCW_03665 [Candidatus Hodarchaeota archaeon]
MMKMATEEVRSRLRRFGTIWRVRKYTVAEGKPDDKSLVRIDKKTMSELEVKPGDTIWVVRYSYVGAKLAGTVARLLPEDEGKGIVRLSKDLLEKGEKIDMGCVTIGTKVILSKSAQAHTRSI